MTQGERRRYLLETLKQENPSYADLSLPANEVEQKWLLRALFNVRMPKPAGREFLRIQDEYLAEEIRQKGITDIAELSPIQPDLYLWQGDITTLRCDVIVNAANRQLLGCFCPNHGCIDNAIHTWAGVQLRLCCAELMAGQGHDEEPGRAKITPAYNLPAKYVIHTVGPLVDGQGKEKDCAQLKSCYSACLELAAEKKLQSIAFCCISTGEFHFPNEKAAEIAVRTVQDYKAKTQSEIKVIFNVFKDRDYEIYRKQLRSSGNAEKEN